MVYSSFGIIFWSDFLEVTKALLSLSFETVDIISLHL